MEEEIKIIEEMLNSKEPVCNYKLKYQEIEAISNLLTGYKELEEENKQLEAIKDEAIRRYNFESISKSLVKEKIEELDKRIDFLNTELTKCYIEREKLGTETDIDNNETYIFYIEEEKNFREKQKEVLQDLLGKE